MGSKDCGENRNSRLHSCASISAVAQIRPSSGLTADGRYALGSGSRTRRICRDSRDARAADRAIFLVGGAGWGARASVPVVPSACQSPARACTRHCRSADVGRGAVSVVAGKLGAGRPLRRSAAFDRLSAGVGDPDADDLDRFTASLRALAFCRCEPFVRDAVALDLDRLGIRILQCVAGRTHQLRRLSVHFVIKLEHERCRLVPCRAPCNPSPP
jgi:hypothetical protein